MLIVGIGVVPNAELAAAAGLAIAQRHPRRRAMRSSAPDILAIGDCANYRHWFTGADVRLESVQNATDQAKLAARTITGHADSLRRVPWFWSDIGDMKLQMVGLTGRQRPARRARASRPRTDSRCSTIAGERLIGIESVNRPADHMLGRKMMGAGLFARLRKLAASGRRCAEGGACRMAGNGSLHFRREIDAAAVWRQRCLKVLPVILPGMAGLALPKFRWLLIGAIAAGVWVVREDMKGRARRSAFAAKIERSLEAKPRPQKPLRSKADKPPSQACSQGRYRTACSAKTGDGQPVPQKALAEKAQKAAPQKTA